MTNNNNNNNIDLARRDLIRALTPPPALSSTATPAEFRALSEWLDTVAEACGGLRSEIIRAAAAANGRDGHFRLTPRGENLSFRDLADELHFAAVTGEQSAAERLEAAE